MQASFSVIVIIMSDFIHLSIMQLLENIAN